MNNDRLISKEVTILAGVLQIMTSLEYHYTFTHSFTIKDQIDQTDLPLKIRFLWGRGVAISWLFKTPTSFVVNKANLLVWLTLYASFPLGRNKEYLSQKMKQNILQRVLRYTPPTFLLNYFNRLQTNI